MRTSFLTLVTTLVTCFPAMAAEPRQGGEIRLALSSDITSSEPGIRRSGDSDTVLLHVVESLVAYREDMTIAPMLAESFTTSEDGRTYTFKLRDGIKFHNGAPLTATDVKWSWDRILDPKRDWQCRFWYDGSEGAKVESIATPDDKTVVFNLSAASPLFVHYMANIQCMTGIMHKDSLGADGEWRAPVGTGPFSFADWRKGSYVLLKRFADYKPRTEPRDGLAGGKIAYADTLRWMVIPDASTRKTALRAGEVDWINADVADMAEMKNAPGVKVMNVQGLNWNVLLVQTKDPLFADLRMRQALAHAIDLDALVGMRTDGIGKPNPSAIPTTSPAYSQVHSKGYAFDPEMSRKLLKEAGYDGRPIKLQTNQKLSYMYDTGIILQAMLTEAGFNVELEVLEWATQLDRYLKGDFQLQSFRYSARLEPSLNYRTFVGSKQSSAFNQWDDPKAIKLLAEANVESDPARRQAIFDELHKAMIEQTPIVSLYNSPLVDMTNMRIGGAEMTSFDKIRGWGVWVEK